MKETPENIAKLIVRYSESEPLGEDEARELWEWLNADEDNRTLLYESKYMLHKLKTPPEIHLDQCYRELTGRIASSGLISPTPRLKVIRRAALYAASLIAAIAVGVGASHFITGEAAVRTEYIHISAGPGDMSEIRLPDGSTVVLKPSSKLTYPTSFVDGERSVKLTGEAFFEVTTNRQRPFTVESERQRVRVFGTSFNVMAYPGYNINQVTLLSGSVEMSVLDKDGYMAGSFMMTPDQQATFDRATGAVSVHMLSKNDADRDWTANVYYFENRPLSEIAGRLEHYYGVGITIADEEIASTLYSGTLSLDMDIKETLSALNIEKDFTIEGAGQLFVLKK